MPPILDIPAGDLLVNLEFGFSNRASDLDNPVKPIMDILQKRYGFNDSQVCNISSLKELCQKELNISLLVLIALTNKIEGGKN